MQPNDIINNLPKLRWACRRGMLELDVLLGNFLKDCYSQLTDEDKLVFVDLLQCTDPELFTWLLGSSAPPDKFQRIVQMIRQNAQHGI